MVRLTGHLAVNSGRPPRFPSGDGDGPRATVPCFAICANERSSRPPYTRHSGPEIAETERDRIERADAYRIVVLCARNQEPLPIVEFERLKGAVRRVDKP